MRAEPWRTVVMWAAAALVAAVLGYSVWDKEQVLAHGQTVLLKLRPVDPRSLIQGDYMVLRYELGDAIATALGKRSADGHVVVTLDADGVAQFVRLARSGEQPGEGERLLLYRKRNRVVRLGSNAFFFQEGQAAVYAGAKYGELRADDAGNMVLVGLRDAERAVLGPVPAQHAQAQ